MTARVVIAQPYVPKYRVAFFEALRQQLENYGVDCVIAAGAPRGDQAARGDAVRPNWIVPVQNRSFSAGSRSFDYKISPTPWRNTDAVILGLEGSSLPVYQALASKKFSGVRVGLWGHVRPYVSTGNKLDLWLEKQQMHFADHVFSYTPGGTSYALAAGVPSEKITTVMNSVNTEALERVRDGITAQRISDFSNQVGTDPSRTLCFVGGLDHSKRIGFLAEALDSLWRYDTSIRVLVGGDGPQKHLLHQAFERGQAVDLGYMTTELKALAISASQAILMPGRIGLVAVDALIMRRPVITTQWPFHAPEAEYLSEGISRLTTSNDVGSFVDGIQRALVNKSIKRSVSNFTDTAWQYPTMDAMVKNYAKGVLTLLG